MSDVILGTVYKHLQGKHDQKTHGRRGIPDSSKSIWNVGDTRVSIDAPGSVKGNERKLSQSEIDAIKKYTGGGYRDLNGALSSGSGLSEENKNIYDNLNSAIDKAGTLENPVTVLRGVRGSIYSWNMDNKIDQFESQIGKVISMPGFQSSSFFTEPVLDASMSLTKGYVFEITTKKGIYINEVSKYPDEAEFLLGHNWRYKITGVERNVKFEAGDYQDILVRHVVKLEVVE